MDIRTAILKAADYIERNPHEFNFVPNHIPSPGCGTPGCASGWIGFFLGIPNREEMDRFGGPYHAGTEDVCKAIGCPPAEKTKGVEIHHRHLSVFLARMNDISKSLRGEQGISWIHNAKWCADTMRQYANQYHPAIELDPAFVALKAELERFENEPTESTSHTARG